MATARRIIASALRKIGVYPSGEAPTAEEYADCLEELGDMLASWSASGLLVPILTVETFSLESGTAAYTMGSGGTASSTRAKRILSAFVRDSDSIDHQLVLRNKREYDTIDLKTNPGRPRLVAYDPQYPLGYLYFYPTPNAVETVHLRSLKSMTEPSSLTASVSLPDEYRDPIKYELAVRMAPEFQVSVSRAVMAAARDGKDRIKRLNAAARVRSVPVPVGVGGRYVGITGGGETVDMTVTFGGEEVTW